MTISMTMAKNAGNNRTVRINVFTLLGIDLLQD